MTETDAPYRSDMASSVSTSSHLVVVGAGMVAHRFLESLRAREGAERLTITVIGEEDAAPYDRVGLTSFFSAASADELSLSPEPLDGIRFLRGERAVRIDREARTVTTDAGSTVRYDELVLATGSYAAELAVEGYRLAGVFVYRTLDDVRGIREWIAQRSQALGRPLRGAVIGGGLLGLEAAGALDGLGVGVTIVQSSNRLLSAQVDDAGGEALRRLIEQRGLDVRTNSRTTELAADAAGRVAGLRFDDLSTLDADIVIFSVGVRPRDELARAAGLEVAPRGGVVIDDGCRTSDPAIWAIGEVAAVDGQCFGLVAPGYSMAEVAADRLAGGDAVFPGADLSTKLKLSGVEVASFGDAFGATPGSLDVVYADPIAGVYKKLVLSDDAKTLLGGILVGDASNYSSLRPLLGAELGADPSAYLLPSDVEAPTGELPDAAVVCSCNNVAAHSIRSAVTEEGCTDVAGVKACTRAGAACGSCVPLVKKLVNAELAKAGRTVSTALCEHFPLSRAQLFDAVRITGLRSFSEILERHGSGGRGCDLCKPAVASILASLGNVHPLDGENATLQDTNDHVMANLQRDGSYSVVPRIPGGEITPEGLVVIGEVARDFGLYTKITGGQRIDLFGARLEQLPDIWRRLVDAGFESGHAYGKSLRTVKSCVGSTWCRYGVQDSVKLAIDLELRYRGLRSPHKFKMGVSGCARECAEARGKDVGVIATEKGWNLYVGGNGGFTPRHAQLLAEDLDTETLIRTIDRFVLYYVRTADRLQRTAPWVEELEGGIDGLRDVVLNDSLGIAEDLDEAMARHVDTYRDEWKATLEDPEKLARFASFVNAPRTPDPSLAYVEERGQRRPATDAERSSGISNGGVASGAITIAGPTLEVVRS